MSELKKKLERVNLSVLQAMCTKKHLNVSAKSDKPGKKGTKLNLTKDALIYEMLKKPADDIERVYATFLTDGEDKFVKESEPRNESMAPTEAADTADTADKQQKKDIEKFSDKRRANKVINKLKTMVNNTKMSKEQLLEKIWLMEHEEKVRKDLLYHAEDETKGMMRNIKKKLDTTTENEKAPAATPVSTPASTPPPTPKNSPQKTDDTRDYKQVKFQGLTKDENSNAKVQVKMARVQITKSDIEKELEKQNNRRFGFQHNKISYNTHWGKQGSKISSELI